MTLTNPGMKLIDLDGTLVGSVPDLAWCVDKTMKTRNMPTLGEAKVRNYDAVIGNVTELKSLS